eukprot:15440982-Alexandrium_andersonii.AAC.1
MKLEEAAGSYRKARDTAGNGRKQLPAVCCAVARVSSHAWYWADVCRELHPPGRHPIQPRRASAPH